jgi:ABC-type multidrug transport system permease subunit
MAFPTNFGSNYIRGATGLKLEVIKNPAQSFMPAIVEELGAVTVSGLNAISRNLNSEFPKIRAATTNADNSERIADIVKRVGDRLKNLRTYIDPPLVSYEKFESYEKPIVIEKPVTATSTNVTSPSPAIASSPAPVQPQKAKAGMFNIFAYILPGMASAFLLFIADQSMRDFHREVRMKTLDRQRTIGAGAGMFITGKILFTALSVAIAAAILFGGGALTFRIRWNHPGLLALACVGYSLFAAGLMAALSALAPSERRVDVLNSMLIFSIAFLGGSYLPADNFPRFLREHISTLMPNYWLIESMRALQRGDANYIAPLMVVAKLTIAGAILGLISALIIERRLTSGARA